MVADDAVTGMAKINYANQPEVRIDRRSGSVARDGKGGAFAGQCHTYDSGRRAFWRASRSMLS